MDHNLDEIARHISRSCNHRELVELPVARAEHVWQDTFPRGAEVFLEAASLCQCKRCSRVFLPEPYRPAEEGLRQSLAHLAGLLPQVSEVTVRVGRRGKHAEAAPQPDRSGQSHTQAQFTAVPPRFRLPDVILPQSTLLQIEEAVVKVTSHKKIYEEWGFNKVDPTGRGVVLNFYGPSGTGKTRCAEALAGALGMSFMLVSNADLESRFMGDTSVNIRRAFAAAAAGGALLFFDEADTVLGRRLSSVTQGVDAEINSARATMLTEMDRFEGTVVFATNFPRNVDAAFRRRISHHIRFDLPDLETRRRLWDLHLVPAIPLAEERQALIERLARGSETLSGGDILTALRLALPAALRAGGDDAALSSEQVLEAVRRVLTARREVGDKGAWWQEPVGPDEFRALFGGARREGGEAGGREP